MPPTLYPGIGLPLVWRERPGRPLYAIGAHRRCLGYSSPVLPIREVFMMALMDALTDKPDWHEKVFDDAIVAKWRKEAMEQPEDELYARILDVPPRDLHKTGLPKPRARILSDKAFDNCIAELRSKAALCKETGLVHTLDSIENTVIKSDHTLVSEELHRRLVDAFAELRLAQAANVDWHPGTDDKVQDLVHPSLYPFVFGRSAFLPSEEVGTQNALDYMTKGTAVPLTEKPPQNKTPRWLLHWREPEHRALWSNRFQWLPANVGFDDDGKARFTSYINNLHPTKHAEIYPTIERLVDAALPAWNRCLKYYEPRRGSLQVAARAGYRSKPRFATPPYCEDDDPSWWEPFNAEVLRASHFQLSPHERGNIAPCIEYERRDPPFPEQQEAPSAPGVAISPNDIPQEDIDQERWMRIRDPVLPEPLDFEATDHACADDLRAKFRAAGLQVVVKMASIELTPEKPAFAAGGWHIEGQLHERIVGTALYYVDSENVTPSHLSFRMQTNPPDDFGYDRDCGFLERVYGTKLDGSRPCLQYYGDVATTPGRFLAFPNVFQHRVSGFRLQDPTKPGHRRFIALWLIDPTRRIISTANVPPQQAEWWREAVLGGDGDGVRGHLPQELATLLAEQGVAVPAAATRAARLPAELVHMIRRAAPATGLVSRAEAERYRLELMEERSRHQKAAENEFARTAHYVHHL